MRSRWVMVAAGIGVAVALAFAAWRAGQSHRRAAERVLRDYAGVAGSELVRRTAFDVGFNGYQIVAAGLTRTAAAGELRLGPRLPAEARALVAHLFVVEDGAARLVHGAAPPPWLAPWVAAEAGALPADREPFVARHRVVDGRAATLVLVPLDETGRRTAAFDVALDALRPFFERSLARGPLLPGMIGDGHVDNDVLSLVALDPAGGERLRAGAGRWPEWEITVPFGDFYRGVLAGSVVRVAVDPAIAGRLLPGGLPGSPLPALAALLGAALLVAAMAVRQARRERELARAREDFVVGVSHELRTPLAQIQLFTETVLLGRCRSPDEERRFLHAVARETARLGNLVGNVLDFARAERGVLDVVATPTRLAPLVARVVDGFAPLAATRRVQVAARLDPEAAAAVDDAGFTRLLLNLLDNAVKYGPERGAVTVSLARAAGAVELAVEDRGPGVPPGEREAIFAPFRRLGRDRGGATTGAGIGLTLVRELAARHGGSCRVETRDGGGARFVVRLPAAPAPVVRA